MNPNLNNLKGYNGNILLKKSNQSIEWTPDLVQEYVKCSQDPIYFIRNYCYIVSLDHGLVKFDLYPCQVNKINVIHNNIIAWIP